MNEPKTYQCSKVQKTCVYASFIRNSNYGVCDYIGVTGKRRGCSPECCDKYEKRGKDFNKHKRFRQTFEQIDIF